MNLFCLGEMFNIMYYCWDANPEDRLSFSQLVKVNNNIYFITRFGAASVSKAYYLLVIRRQKL